MTISPGTSTGSLPSIRHGLDLTEEQESIREMVREFARNELAPIAAEIDAGGKETLVGFV
jgi:alkylation response protein AidB-like acyl-CoA dehydrogenase